MSIYLPLLRLYSSDETPISFYMLSHLFPPTSMAAQFPHHPRFSTSPPPPQFNAVFFISEQFNYLTCFLGGSSISNIPLAPFTFLFTSILAFLQLKYQGKEETPFDTHPFLTSVGVVSLIIYCLGYKAEERFSSNLCYRMRVRKYVVCSTAFAGSVSLASTASILFPDSIRPILFVIFLVIPAGELLYFLCRKIVQRIMEFRNNRSPARRPLLPLYF